ncbi:MAG: hypothetical protein NC112_01940, partial [Oxalobacter formigenes]|nr:hypothetical protein [Oxalobacter formigenes]
YVKNHKGLPNRANMVAYEKAVQQLNPPPFSNQAGIEYVGKDKCEALTYCRYSGTDFEKTVAVVGDSHANSAYSGIAKLGKEMGFNTVILGNPLDRMKLFLARGEDSKIIDVLLKKADVKLVFLIFRFPKYIVDRHRDKGSEWFETARKNGGSFAFSRMKLQDMVDKLKAAGKEVIIVGDNPTLPVDARNYVKRLVFFAGKERVPSGPLQQDIREGQEKMLTLLFAIKGATVVSLVDVFCPLDKCRVFDRDGLLLYYDDTHLSEVGSDFQAREAFLPYLERWLGKQREQQP